MLMTSQPSALNHFDSARVEKRGPWMTTMVPLSCVSMSKLRSDVEGNYLDLLGYQSRLEKLPWRMFFARTSVNSVDYPKVLMTITLFTLSLEEAWLVV